LSHLSDTYVRSKKMLKLLEKIKNLFNPTEKILGDEIRVAEIRLASKIAPGILKPSITIC